MAFKAQMGGKTGLSGEKEGAAALGLFGLAGLEHQTPEVRRHAGARFQAILGQSMDSDGFLAPTAKNPWQQPGLDAARNALPAGQPGVRVVVVAPTTGEHAAATSLARLGVSAASFSLDAEGRLLDGDGRPVLGLPSLEASAHSLPLQSGTASLCSTTLTTAVPSAPQALGTLQPSCALPGAAPVPLVVPLSLTGNPTTTVQVTAILAGANSAVMDQLGEKLSLSRTVAVFDENGQPHTLGLRLEGGKDGLFTWTAEMDGAELAQGIPGVPVVVGSGSIRMAEGTNGEAVLLPCAPAGGSSPALDPNLSQGPRPPAMAGQHPQVGGGRDQEGSGDVLQQLASELTPSHAPILPQSGLGPTPGQATLPTPVTLTVDFVDVSSSQSITLLFGAPPATQGKDAMGAQPPISLESTTPVDHTMLGAGLPTASHAKPEPILEIALEAVDGAAPEALVEVTIAGDGRVTGRYSRGTETELGALCVPLQSQPEQEDFGLRGWDPTLPTGLGLEAPPLASAAVAAAAEMVEGALGRTPLTSPDATHLPNNPKDDLASPMVGLRRPEVVRGSDFVELMQRNLKGSPSAEVLAEPELPEENSDESDEAERFALAIADALNPPPPPPQRHGPSDAWQSAVGAMTALDSPVENRGAAKAAAAAFESNLGLENPSRVQIRVDVGEAGETACIVERQGPNLKILVSSADPHMLSLLETQRQVMVETLRASGQAVSTIQIVRMEEAGTNLAQSFGQPMKRPKTRGTEDDEHASARARRKAPRINVTG